MKKLLFLFLFLFTTNCFGAELLIRAKPHWMDSLKPAQVSKLSTSELEGYNARTQIGDVIVVRPDGWVWGKEECLPNFIIVKLPGVSIDLVKKYEEGLSEQYTDTEGQVQIRLLKRRKYRIPQVWVENYKTLNQSIAVINLSIEQTALLNNIIQKTQ